MTREPMPKWGLCQTVLCSVPWLYVSIDDYGDGVRVQIRCPMLLKRENTPAPQPGEGRNKP